MSARPKVMASEIGDLPDGSAAGCRWRPEQQRHRLQDCRHRREQQGRVPGFRASGGSAPAPASSSARIASVLPRDDAAAVAASFPAGDRNVCDGAAVENSLTLPTSGAAAIQRLSCRWATRRRPEAGCLHSRTSVRPFQKARCASRPLDRRARLGDRRRRRRLTPAFAQQRHRRPGSSRHRQLLVLLVRKARREYGG